MDKTKIQIRPTSTDNANQNEQKHSLNILKKTELILKQSAGRLKSVIADSQYSDGKLRDAVEETVIPYRANQKRDVKGLLRKPS